MNQDLMEPGQTQPKVSAPAALTEPMPIVKTKIVKYYYCSVSTASMHRKDGKKLAFVNGILATDDKFDQEYLDAEIEAKNTYLAHADNKQVESYKMQMNPRETIADQVRAELEPQLRNELEDKIRQELLAGLRAGTVVLSDDTSKLAGTTATPANKQVEGAGFTASIVSSTAVAKAAAGAGSGVAAPTMAQRLAALSKK